ncbi:hypothetical protein CBM2608_A50044 [Cupriavidus taiwanensis]|nr:hypothetical protein CBM2608_A50044 [Cupriavidus taiwanensis]
MFLTRPPAVPAMGNLAATLLRTCGYAARKNWYRAGQTKTVSEQAQAEDGNVQGSVSGNAGRRRRRRLPISEVALAGRPHRWRPSFGRAMLTHSNLSHVKGTGFRCEEPTHHKV